MKPTHSLLAITAVLALPIATAFAGPPNDNFTDRIACTGANVVVGGTNIGATIETGEPNHGVAFSKTGGKSIWWTWTAPFAGYVTVTDLANFNHLLAVYAGSALTNLTLVGSDYDSSTYSAAVNFNALAGGTYQFAVDGQSGASGTNLLTLTLVPPPANDNFADRIVLAGPSVLTNGSNIGATRELGEPNHAGLAGAASAWWTWTAPAPGGRVTISISGDFYSALGIYTGSAVSNLSFVTSASGSSGYPAKAVFDAVAGVAYQIAVDGARPTDLSSGIALQLTLQPPPANDNFVSAATLSGTNLLLSLATNISATTEPGEPNHAGRVGGRSVWWNWTAPVSGHFVALVSGYFNKLVGVYTGDSVSSLTEVGAGYGTTNNLAQAGFNATAGTVYRLAVDGENGAATTFSLELRLPPLNDDFANRFTLVGTNLTVTATNSAATKEPGEPIHAGDSGGKSLWWTWTAPVAGRVMVTATASSFGPLVAVYSGTNFASLTTNATGYTYSSTPAYANFDAVAGTSYQIAVDGQYGSGGPLTLQLKYVTAPPNDFFTDAQWVTNAAPAAGPVTNHVPADFYVTGSTLGATKEPGESWQGTASSWWLWTAPTNGEVLIELETYYPATMTYPWLMLYRGTTISNLTTVSPRVEFAGQMNYHDARFPVTAGTTYHIWAANRSGAEGSYTLRGKFETVPLNDNFTNRIRVENTDFLMQYGYVYLYGWNCCATKETAEPLHGGPSYYYGGKSVWWTWTAPANGRATFGAIPQRYGFSSMVGVYTGTTVSNLSRVAYAYTTCTDGSSSVPFAVTAGTTYQLAIDGGGSYGDSGEYKLSLDVKLDTNAPSVTITNPAPGRAFSGPASTVSGTAADPAGAGSINYSSGVNLVEVRLNGGAWLPATGTNVWSRALTLNAGANLIEIRARDAVGNYSSLASVTATFGTLLSRLQMSAGVPQFSFPTESGKNYQLEWVDNLAPPLNWQPVAGANVPGTGSTATCLDTNCAGPLQRFYRLSAY